MQLQGLLDESNEAVRPGLEAAIENIDATIRAIRSAVFAKAIFTIDSCRSVRKSG